MSCKKGSTYELFFKYIHNISLTCLRNEEAITSTWSRISSWQVFNFLLYRQSSILQDILFYIWYLTICFWIDWVHVYTQKLRAYRFKYERNYTVAREQKKWWKWNNESLQHPTSQPHHLPHWSKFCSLRFFFFLTTCSKVISTFKQ